MAPEEQGRHDVTNMNIRRGRERMRDRERPGPSENQANAYLARLSNCVIRIFFFDYIPFLLPLLSLDYTYIRSMHGFYPVCHSSAFIVYLDLPPWQNTWFAMFHFP